MHASYVVIISENMRYLSLLLTAIFIYFPLPIAAQWAKISDADYVWGPFKIYNIALFSENGGYSEGMRPLMLTLKYAKPVEGRDFAISLARSWSNLGMTLPDQEVVVERLRKIMPNIRTDDELSYIALEDKGYFILNNQVIPAEFNQDFSNAVVAVWLDPRVEIGRKLLKGFRQEPIEVAKPTGNENINAEKEINENSMAVDVEENIEKLSEPANMLEKKNTNPEIEIYPPFDPPLKHQ